MPASLTPKQFKLLRAVTVAGWCVAPVTAPYNEAWAVRTLTLSGGSTVLTFTERTSDVLLSRGFIQPDQRNHEIRNPQGVLILRRYVPTALGRGVVARGRRAAA